MDVLRTAKLQADSGQNLSTPIALPPPIGRPVKEAGHRRKAWYERGPDGNKKRIYQCWLYRLEGHIALNCELRQG